MTIGSDLQAAREQHGLTLREISDRTKIRIPVLRAIENDDFSHVPGGIIVRGFLKLYAREVGLDPEEIARRFAALQADAGEASATFASAAGEPSTNGHTTAAGEPSTNGHRTAAGEPSGNGHTAAASPVAAAPDAAGPQPARHHPTPADMQAARAAIQLAASAAEHKGSRAFVGIPQLPTAAIIAVAVAGIVVAGFLLSAMLEREPGDPAAAEPPAASAPDTTAQTSTARGGDAEAGQARPAATAATPGAAAPTPAPAAEGALRVDIEATSPCWVAATADGKQVSYRVLNPGERVSFTVTSEAVLRIGMPGNVAMSINDTRVKPFAPPGTPTTLRITPTNYRELLAP